MLRKIGPDNVSACLLDRDAVPLRRVARRRPRIVHYDAAVRHNVAILRSGSMPDALGPVRAG
jgi:hypothetical protein